MTEIKTIKQYENFMYRHCINEEPPLDLYELHTHSFYELIYILSGEVTHVVENRRYKLKRNDLVIIRPFDSHYIQINASADYERYNILFDGEALGINKELLPHELDVIHASRGDVTESYLYRLFKNELRLTPKKYIMQKRLLYAENLIMRGSRPTDIYAECGFKDYTTFYRNYTTSFGHSPSERDGRKISFLD